ncbi:hypothetical protein M758_1G280800 [Ceratodon purpureus]|nr:hypothetical protein M758_1G280800 [Ceratodon purpureus]
MHRQNATVSLLMKFLIMCRLLHQKRGCAHDNILHVLCKATHLALKSHMPSAILATLGQWFNDFVLLLDVVKLEKRMDLPEQVARLKTWKHVLQICCNLISRHRKHVDKLVLLLFNILSKGSQVQMCLMVLIARHRVSESHASGIGSFVLCVVSRIFMFALQGCENIGIYDGMTLE